MSNYNNTEFENAVSYICGAVEMAQFSSCYYHKDQLDKQIYHSKDIITTPIKGGRCLYYYPYGTIRHTKENYYRMACANAYFMIKKCAIPIEQTNIPEICNVVRSDGRLHKGRIVNNESLYFNTKHEKLVVNVDFNSEEQERVEPQKLELERDYKHSEKDRRVFAFGDEMSKACPIRDFMEANNMDVLKISLKSINPDEFIYEGKEEEEREEEGDNNVVLKEKIIEHFNDDLKTWVLDTLKTKLEKAKIPAIILLDNEKIFE